MITKTYKSRSNISINVINAAGKGIHVSFMPQSDGTSVFTTSDTQLQKAIEHHYKFGVLFTLLSCEGVPESRIPKKKEISTISTKVEDSQLTSMQIDKAEDSELQSASQSKESGEKAALKELSFSDFGVAKEYLSERFGISKKDLSSQNKIMAQGEAQGIKVVIIS